MTMRQVAWILAAAALVARGCQRARGTRTTPREQALSMGCTESSLPVRLDRGDWMVNQRKTVWKVMEGQDRGPPKRVGYLVKTEYRQLRGGPRYDEYKRLAVVKYMQYLASRQDVLRSIYIDKTRGRDHHAEEAA
ncbi:MAG: hypothetical protein ACC662_05445, partial [Planctomycetota bacterium]